MLVLVAVLFFAVFLLHVVVQHTFPAMKSDEQFVVSFAALVEAMRIGEHVRCRRAEVRIR
jgi:hypothetical protein